MASAFISLLLSLLRRMGASLKPCFLKRPPAMPLTDFAIKNARARSKPYKLGDYGGLFIQVQPTGSKLWRLKYRIEGKAKVIALGAYPAVPLLMARQRRDEARAQLAQGQDPARERMLAKYREIASSQDTFAKVAQEFIDKRRLEGMSEGTAKKCEYYISRLGSAVGRLPITKIATIDVLVALRKIEAKRNYETARRVLQLAGRVFRYAVATARIAVDPPVTCAGRSSRRAQALWGDRRAETRRRSAARNRRLCGAGDHEAGLTPVPACFRSSRRVAKGRMERDRFRSGNLDDTYRKNENAPSALCASFAPIARNSAGAT
jgi:hypothetical protein